MFDRAAFIRPIAHRGLHDAKKGRVENTAPAFEAAIAKGYGIECDLRPAAGGLPIVFHDETLNRLVAGKGPVAGLDARDLKRLRYEGADTHILTFAELLDMVDGAVPLLVEIKSEWTPPDHAFLSKIARLAQSYKGPLALMSFDPDVMAALRELAPKVPRGIVSGTYAGHGWWNRRLTKTRAEALRDLLLSGPVAPHFYAYQVSALPTPVTRFVREVLEIPLFTWTVRSAKDRLRAGRWADAPIFEGYEP
ncbi:MAG: glycerophosphodiester phosphodiesterase family protein [Hyphomicrobium sp.]